ncbi:MAG: trypsin-like peptidase domain-containing protein [Candidatus Doudnabacteria bacterium]|nr:trypsin-like peptidase domain-containing protein [Candidatus Doudnabacteria bacterium]
MKKFLPILIIVVILAASDAGAIFWYQKQAKKQEQSQAAITTALQKQISGLQSQITLLGKQNAASALSAQEAANSRAVVQKSQQQLVTEAVAKAAPAVVSIIISQDVPQYKVVYQNPFGDDPFFQNVGMQVPVYVPTGQTKSQEVGAGSGYLITSDGYIITNKHVVADNAASYTVLLQTGKQQTAKVIYKDPNNDLAIIKISGSNYPTVSFDDSNSLQLGETVIAIGNALGQYNNSVSLGVISGLNRTIQASDQSGSSETLNGVIQTDAAINPGNSGGPLLDLNGNAVGINVATVQGSNNISFSIPSNVIRSIIKSAINR